MVAPLLFFAYMIVYYNVIKTHCITGLGYAMLIVSSFIAIYYAVIIAYCLYFFVASMQAEEEVFYVFTKSQTFLTRIYQVDFLFSVTVVDINLLKEN
jgi:SNF family Na+-dependent transporter